jgi:ATP-dependent DNA ligase
VGVEPPVGHGRAALSVRIAPARAVGSRSSHRSLLVASVQQGVLRYVGQVTSGLSDRLRTDLQRRLARRRRPVVACPHQASWVEPNLYCRVRFQQWTPHGRLRGAAFAGLLDVVGMLNDRGVEPKRAKRWLHSRAASWGRSFCLNCIIRSAMAW